MIITTPRFLSLEPVLRCPDRRCHRMVFAKDPEIYLGGLTCDRCGAHWWATRLQAGNVREQLLHDYEGEAFLVAQLMILFGLPETIEQPMFWQVWLSGNEWYRYNKDTSSGIRSRSKALLQRVVSLLKRAS